LSTGKIKRLYLIPILSKALDVLEMLEQQNSSMTLEDVYQRTQISKTSVYRILKTLVHRGYVAHNESGEYRLVSRPRRLKFGLAVQSADLPFSQQVAASVTAAAASSGVELLVLDNHFDAQTAIRNAEEFVAKRVDLMLEFQAEEHVAAHVAYIFKNAGIPLIAIDVPHPNATYFGVDNFEVGYEAGVLLAQFAQRNWKGKVDCVLGIGLAEAGNYVQSRITGAFEAIRTRLDNFPADRLIRLEGRGMRSPTAKAVSEFLQSHQKNGRVLVAAATDSSALGVLDAVRNAGCEENFAIVGQDCIPEVLSEMENGKSAIIGSISHEAQTYGPTLIQLGITIVRGNSVPPYNYVRHQIVTRETIELSGSRK
jgi:ribose transport system substrate-binding protein